MSKITKQQLDEFDLTHRSYGNGLACVQVLDSEYVRVTPLHGKEFCDRVYLAATTVLSVTQVPSDPKNPKSPPMDVRIKEDQLEPLNELRQKLKSGALKVKMQRVSGDVHSLTL